MGLLIGLAAWGYDNQIRAFSTVLGHTAKIYKSIQVYICLYIYYIYTIYIYNVYIIQKYYK